MARRVEATKAGYAPRVIGGLPERIAAGDIIEVADKATAKWWKELDAPKPGRKPKEDTAAEA